jgi:hypothetical protein
MMAQLANIHAFLSGSSSHSRGVPPAWQMFAGYSLRTLCRTRFTHRHCEPTGTSLRRISSSQMSCCILRSGSFRHDRFRNSITECVRLNGDSCGAETRCSVQPSRSPLHLVFSCYVGAGCRGRNAIHSYTDPNEILFPTFKSSSPPFNRTFNGINSKSHNSHVSSLREY